MAWEREPEWEGDRNVWRGHGITKSMALSADGLTLARLGGAAGSILALDARTGRMIGLHQPNSSDWMRFDSYGRGSSLASVGRSGFLVWDGHSKVLEHLAFRPERDAGASDRKLALSRTLDIAGEVTFSAVSTASGHLAAATRDAVHLVALRAPSQSIVLDDPFVQSMGFTSDGKRLITTRWHSGSDLFRVWDVDGGQLLKSISIPPRDGYADGVSSVASVPDSNRVVVSGWKCGVALIDARLCEVVGDLTSSSTGVTAVAVSPDGELAALGHLTGDVRIVNIRAARADAAPAVDLWARSDVRARVEAVAWLAERRVLGVALSGGGWKSIRLEYGVARVETAAIQPPSRLTAVGAGDEVVVAAGWGREVWVRSRGKERIVRLPISESDGVVAVACALGPGSITIGTRGGRLLGETESGEFKDLLHLTGPVAAMAVSLDGSRTFAFGVTGVVVELPVGSEPSRILRSGSLELRCSAISVDGLSIALVDERRPMELCVYRRATLRDESWERSVVRCAYPIHCCCLSHDGKRVAAGDDEYGVLLWEPDSRRAPARLVGHERRVNALAFFGDGSMLVSGGDDFALRLWEVQSAREASVLTGAWSAVSSVAVSRDGRRVVAGGADGGVCVWRRVGK